MSELLVSAIEPDTVLAGRFRVEEKLADGAVASVYRAKDDVQGHSVALKILDPLRGADPVGRMRFEREFEVLSRLSHPSIARCLQSVKHEDLDILVLEFIEGESLAERLRRGRLEVDRAVEVALQAAKAIAAAHQDGVIHRDLKPANIMLHPERGAVLLDFGVAWFSSAANLTRTGAMVGSPQYIAPEVFSSSLHDGRSDVYALGAILFEMLTGRTVWLADTVPALVELQRRGDPPTVVSLRPEVGPPLSQVVARAIATAPESRFATADALAEALTLRAPPAARILAERLPCKSCATPLLIDLPFCPGCGTPVSWRLSPGTFAVQIHEVPDPDKAAAWILDRHGYAFPGLRARLSRRFAQTPVPLVVDASKESAEKLVAEAKERGMNAEIIQARAVIGAKLRIADATFAESLATLVLHFGVVLMSGALLIMLGLSFFGVSLLPFAVGVIGLLLARAYVRRPILQIPPEANGALAEGSVHAKLLARLGSLKSSRARRLSAGAFARAAPVLVSDTHGLAGEAPADAIAALERAVDAALAADSALARLDKKSRSRLAAELADAEARAERGTAGAVEALATLEQEKAELYDAAVAHDLAVREALEATEAISRALGTRTLDT